MSKKIAFVYPAKINNPDKALTKFMDKPVQDQADYVFLCSQEKEKILKKDIDCDIEKLKSDYEIIVPIGAESLKYVCGLTGITKYNGMFIEKKYLPLLNPSMIVFKPQYEEDIIKAFSMLNRILAGEVDNTTHEKDYRFIDTRAGFEKYLEDLQNANPIVVDIETSGLNPRSSNVLGIALSTKPHEGIYVSSEICHAYKQQLHDLFASRKCIFHNGKFDMGFLEYEFDFDFPDFDDTMLMHYCLEEAVGTHGLKSLALRFTDLGDYEKELDDYKKVFCRKNKIKLEDFNYGMIPIDILAPYAERDADATFQLYNKFWPLIDRSEGFTKLYKEILLPATSALMRLEKNGGYIDTSMLQEVKAGYEIDIEECINEISMHEAVQRYERLNEKTFNPNSTVQLREVFFKILKLKSTKKTSTGAESTDKEVLQELNHPLAEAILDLREKTKLTNTYLSNIQNGVDQDSRLRSGFNIHGTTSGRLSSSGNLNYQNIPRDNKDIKRMFRARPGFKIMQCDLQTAEVYYAAALSGDKFLQRAFIEKLDFHSYVAKQIFNLPCEVNEVKNTFGDKRQHAKAITFGIMYQAGPAKIAETANVGFTDAKSFINKYFSEAYNLKRWIDSANRQIENNAYIYSQFGRKRRLPESRSPNQGVAKHAIRSGVNFLVQSVASDINVLGLIDAMKWIDEKGYQEDILPFTVVHDSIVAEVRENLCEEWAINCTKALQTPRGVEIEGCPIGVDFEIGPSWGELKGFSV